MSEFGGTKPTSLLLVDIRLRLASIGNASPRASPAVCVMSAFGDERTYLGPGPRSENDPEQTCAFFGASMKLILTSTFIGQRQATSARDRPFGRTKMRDLPC
jgi:hypothetical protein